SKPRNVIRSFSVNTRQLRLGSPHNPRGPPPAPAQVNCSNTPDGGLSLEAGILRVGFPLLLLPPLLPLLLLVLLLLLLVCDVPHADTKNSIKIRDSHTFFFIF